jgi:hypothetical protein
MRCIPIRESKRAIRSRSPRFYLDLFTPPDLSKAMPTVRPLIAVPTLRPTCFYCHVMGLTPERIVVFVRWIQRDEIELNI